jgi:hypothetical protein
MGIHRNLIHPRFGNFVLLATVLITVTSQIPVIGETVMRLRNFAIIKAVLEGGVATPYVVGNRRGHYRAFISLLRNAASWEAATEAYKNMSAPVYLIWGGEDWATSSERDHDRSLLPSVPLDRPKEVLELIARYADGVEGDGLAMTASG